MPSFSVSLCLNLFVTHYISILDHVKERKFNIELFLVWVYVFSDSNSNKKFKMWSIEFVETQTIVKVFDAYGVPESYWVQLET